MMAEPWIYRALLIVVASEQALADAMAVDVGPAGAAEANSFSVPACRIGEASITHYLCCSASTESMRMAVRAAMAAGRVPSLQFYLWDLASEQLVATTSATSGIVGTAFTIDDALSDAGIELYPPSLLGIMA